MGGGSQTSTTRVELSPEQRQVMKGVMGHYMPGGNIQPRPQMNITDPSQQAAGQQRVAPLTPYHDAAAQATQNSAYAHRPGMQTAQQMTMGAAGNAGTKGYMGNGWQQNADGSVRFADFNANTLNQFRNPYQQQVIDTGLQEMLRMRNMAQKDIDLRAGSSNAFGGSRHGLVSTESDRNFLDMGQRFLGDQLANSYNSALGQYNQSFNQGMQLLNQNNQLDQANRQQYGAMGAQLANIAATQQDLDAKGANALQGVGNMYQSQEQAQRDAIYNELMQTAMWEAQLGSVISGFTPPPSQTTTVTGGPSPIWGAMGSILGGLAGLSDERAKDDITPVSTKSALDDIKMLRPISYTYKEGLGDGRHHPRGFRAQDAEKTKGIKVHEIGGLKHFDVQDLLETTVHAIQELDKRVSRVTKRKARAK